MTKPPSIGPEALRSQCEYLGSAAVRTVANSITQENEKAQALQEEQLQQLQTYTVYTLFPNALMQVARAPCTGRWLSPQPKRQHQAFALVRNMRNHARQPRLCDKKPWLRPS